MQNISEQAAPVGDRARRVVARHPGVIALLACGLAYGVVMVTFTGSLPYPDMSAATVEALAHVIATINSLALAAILRGWLLARRGDYPAHRRMMTTAFGLILLFLLIYLFKVGGGGIREFSGAAVIRNFIYLPMLFTHLTLSIVAVPLVSYVLVLGLSRPIAEVPATLHARVGRWAAGAWSASLLLGIGAYVVLNHL